MSCTFSKLLWQRLSAKQCGGWLENVGAIQNLNESVEVLLAFNKCLGDKQSYGEPLTKFDLLANRLCPYQVKLEALSSIDICQKPFCKY